MQQILQRPDHRPPYLTQSMEHCARPACLALTRESQFAMPVATSSAHEAGVIAKRNLLAFLNVSSGEAADGGTFNGIIWDLRIWDARVVDAGQ